MILWHSLTSIYPYKSKLTNVLAIEDFRLIRDKGITKHYKSCFNSEFCGHMINECAFICCTYILSS